MCVNAVKGTSILPPQGHSSGCDQQDHLGQGETGARHRVALADPRTHHSAVNAWKC